MLQKENAFYRETNEKFIQKWVKVFFHMSLKKVHFLNRKSVIWKGWCSDMFLSVHLYFKYYKLNLFLLLFFSLRLYQNVLVFLDCIYLNDRFLICIKCFILCETIYIYLLLLLFVYFLFEFELKLSCIFKIVFV